MNGQTNDAGFGALFDFGFKSFITLSVIKILYILGMVLIALSAVILVITNFVRSPVAGLVMLVLAPILAIIYLIMLRIWLELIVVIFRIGENTSKMAGNAPLNAPPSAPAP